MPTPASDRTTIATYALEYTEATAADFEDLLALRVAAMRESLEAIGRFDMARARSRLAATFEPANTWWIIERDKRVGFYATKLEHDHFLLQHFYLHPDASGRGIGARVMKRLIREAAQAGAPIRVFALRASRSNRFYQAHGFLQVGEDEWDIAYERRPD